MLCMTSLICDIFRHIHVFLHINNRTDNKYLCVSTETNLDEMCGVKNIFVGGTFYSAFTQVVFIITFICRYYFFLLQNKCQIYEKAFTYILIRHL